MLDVGANNVRDLAAAQGRQHEALDHPFVVVESARLVASRGMLVEEAPAQINYRRCASRLPARSARISATCHLPQPPARNLPCLLHGDLAMLGDGWASLHAVARAVV